ncbi:hypothetical protein ABIB17_003911 [Arthrobacter sp. UYEF6]
MTADNPTDPHDQPVVQRRRLAQRSRRKPLSGRRSAVIWTAAAVAAVVLSTIWLGARASEVRQELTAASQLVPRLKAELVRNDGTAAATTVDVLKAHTSKARSSSSDPLWTLAGMIPWIGKNFQAARDVATSADEIVHSAAGPLVTIYQSLDWQNLTPGPEGIDLAPVSAAQPTIAQAAQTVTGASDRLDQIDTAALIPQLSGPLAAARDEVTVLKDSVNAAADFALIAPSMLGADAPRNYLLMIQNNAEARATGGIPGALAKLTVDKGRLSLSSQTTAGALGKFTPPIPVDRQQELVFSKFLGSSMQDVNLTPDFPTAASTAQQMWETKTGERLDGVLSMDPVSLAYVLNATGPVELADPALQRMETGNMPTTLSSQNVVKSLLSDVYAEIPAPELQDIYFATVAHQVFRAVSSGTTDAKVLIDGLTRGANEGRIQVWSGNSSEQDAISKYPLAGSIAGPGHSATEFGVYFNDATGAKMDYYVKRTAQLTEVCGPTSESEVKVTVMATNTAPANAASALPKYVTGGGVYGVPAGTVQTNIVVYGPSGSLVVSAEANGREVGINGQVHSRRPIGTVAVRLAPGESQTLEFTFLKVAPTGQLRLAATPTVFPVSEVALTPSVTRCTTGAH